MGKARFQRRRLVTKRWGSPKLVFVLTILPVLILVAAILGVAWFCRTLLEEAERVDMDLPSLLPMFLGVFGICLVSCFLVVIQGVRLQRRLGGPTLRVIAGMQRGRVGDLSFRVHLRRGDYLSEVAFEFNKVIDWLNENPPEGVRTGSDVVDVYAPDQDDYLDPELADLESDEMDMDTELSEFDRELEAFDLEPFGEPRGHASDEASNEASDEAADEASDEASDEAADEAADEASDEAADEASDEASTEEEERVH